MKDRIARGVASLFGAIARAIGALATPEGRRGWALALLAGGGMAFTAMAAWALYMVREAPDRAFWLGVAAHVQVFAVFTGIAALLVKRRIKWKGFGTDLDIDDTRAARAVQAASEALEQGDA